MMFENAGSTCCQVIWHHNVEIFLIVNISGNGQHTVQNSQMLTFYTMIAVSLLPFCNKYLLLI